MIPTCVSHRIAGTISVERGIGRIKKSSDISWLAHIMNSCHIITYTSFPQNVKKRWHVDGVWTARVDYGELIIHNEL